VLLDFAWWQDGLLVQKFPGGEMTGYLAVNQQVHEMCFFPCVFTGEKASTGYLVAYGLGKTNLSFQLSSNHLLTHYRKQKFMVRCIYI